MTKLSDIKTRVETLLSISVQNPHAIKAYNDFCSMVERAEGKRFAHRGRKEVIVSLPSTGYALSSISNLRNADDGFEVFLLDSDNDVARSYNKLDRIPEGLMFSRGFYIKDGYLFSNIFDFFGAESPQRVLIKYMKKTTREEYTTAPDQITLTMDQDLENALENYMAMLYFQGMYQPLKVAEAQQWAAGWIDDYFSTTAKS